MPSPIVTTSKRLPKPLSAILNNLKKHEVRVNDRDFREGDEVWLRECDPAELLRWMGYATNCMCVDCMDV